MRLHWQRSATVRIVNFDSAKCQTAPVMELHEAIARRRMVRSFAADPLDPALLDQILLDSLRSPTAGNTRGVAWVTLEGPAQTSLYWECATDEEWRTTFSSWSTGLRRAPAVLLAYTSPEAYVNRYAETDKAPSGLGNGAEAWPIPYWYGDAAFAVMALLLSAVDSGLGACVLGNFRGEQELAVRLAIPPDWRLFCAVPLGRPDGAQHRSSSLDRPGPSLAARIHRGRW
jgi:nitroreductase